MTWFRVGGAGIPAALKNAMNAVFNKKFGTTGQNYPPNGWPDDVNLMGPLPEGTASGSIANIIDGADQVPIKLWNSNVDASVDGVSEVNAVRSRKNFLPNKTYQRNANTLRIGTDTLDGRLSLKACTYTLSITSDVVIGTMTYTIGGISTGIPFTSSGTRYYGSFTLSADTDDIFIHVYKAGGYTSENISDFMLEVGNTVTAYEPYEAPTTYTVSLGRTIHGGSLEFISGAGTDENGVNFTFDPISPIPETENVCNFLTNVGSSSIVYRRDIDLALQALSGSRGLSMSALRTAGPISEGSDPVSDNLSLGKSFDPYCERYEDIHDCEGGEQGLCDQCIHWITERIKHEQEGEDDAR